MSYSQTYQFNRELPAPTAETNNQQALVGSEELGTVYRCRQDQKAETGYSWHFLYHVGFPWSALSAKTV